MTQVQLEFLYKIEHLLDEKRIIEMQQFIQHGSISCLKHSIAVAYYSFWLIRKFHIHCNEDALIRGALLHDYFLYDWHEKEAWHKWHGFRHPNFALQNAMQDFILTKTEKEIIKKHMWPLTIVPPMCREAWIVNGMDTCTSLMEVLIGKPFFQRLEKRWFSHADYIERQTQKKL